jgi:uncharacterized membrane protein YfcA
MLLTFLGVFAVLALASVVRSTAGFGFSLIAVPPLAILLDPVTAVVVACIVASPLSIAIAVRHHRHIDRGVLAVVMGCGVAGVPLGVWILNILAERVLMLVIAAVVLLGTVIVWRKVSLRGGKLTLAGVSFFAGASYGSTGIDGPPLIAAAQGLGMAPQVLRSTLSVSFAATGITALAGFAVSGELTPLVGQTVLVGLPGLLIGMVSGEWLFKRLSAERFRQVVLWLLVISSVSVITRALTA